MDERGPEPRPKTNASGSRDCTLSPRRPSRTERASVVVPGRHSGVSSAMACPQPWDEGWRPFAPGPSWWGRGAGGSRSVARGRYLYPGRDRDAGGPAPRQPASLTAPTGGASWPRRGRLTMQRSRWPAARPRERIHGFLVAARQPSPLHFPHGVPGYELHPHGSMEDKPEGEQARAERRIRERFAREPA
jgi:hypothetical protein